MAGGELAAGVDIAIGSPWSPTLLSMAVSLSLGLASLLDCIDVSFKSLAASPLTCTGFSEPFHDGSCHETPVKLLTANVLRAHLRHGLPERSRARRPALIAPWLALGPSL
jgi:hypothetical protein